MKNSNKNILKIMLKPTFDTPSVPLHSCAAVGDYHEGAIMEHVEEGKTLSGGEHSGHRRGE